MSKVVYDAEEFKYKHRYMLQGRLRDEKPEVWVRLESFTFKFSALRSIDWYEEHTYKYDNFRIIDTKNN